MEFTKDIQFNTNPIVNEDLTITYNGFLGNSQELYIVYGYGDNWDYTSETKMEKTDNGFVGTINLLDYEKLNFCFKNSNNEWDNNSYANYITNISPETEKSPNFDIDGLIEELLFEPMNTIEITEEENVDLAYQLSNLIEESEVVQTETVDFNDNSTLDEILTATKNEQSEETSLVEIPDSFIVSSRQASKLYLFTKKIKLAFYKAFVKIPKMLFGMRNEENEKAQ